MKERIIQLITAAALAFGGLALLFTGALLAPQGEIHDSILVAFGEIATFAGSIMGIDYYYKCKDNDNRNSDKTKKGGKSRSWHYRPAIRETDTHVPDP